MRELEARLDRTRPTDSAREALMWDLEIGAAYEKALKDVAFQHFVEAMRLERDEMVRKLVQDESGAESYRAAIRLVDRMLKVPNKMIADGRESGQQLIRGGRDG